MAKFQKKFPSKQKTLKKLSQSKILTQNKLQPFYQFTYLYELHTTLSLKKRCS